MQHLLLALLLPVLALAGCSQTNSVASSPQSSSSPAGASPETKAATGSSSKLKVVATFLPMYWFTKAVAADKADVEIVVPPGTEVHEYQATPANVQAIAKANVLVQNGLGLEEFLEATVKNAGNTQLKQIDASKGIQPLQKISPIVAVSKSTEKEGGEKEHEHAEGNPHVWLDPVLAKQEVANIRDGLIAADPTNKATYEANAAAYIQKLEALDNSFKQSLSKYPNCTFVTFHDAYPYLANRYQLKQVAVVEIPEDNLSPADVQKAVAAAKQYKVKALFGEPGTDNKLLTSLSKDLNLTLRPIDSLETGPQDPEHYFTAMKANLQTLEAACQ